MNDLLEKIKSNWKPIVVWAALFLSAILSGLGVNDAINYANTEKPAEVQGK